MPIPRFFAGRKTTDAIDVPVQLAPPGIKGRVLIFAETDNTGKVAVGGEPFVNITEWDIITNGPNATETTQEGFQLNAGESMPYPVEISEVWIASAVAGDGVAYLFIGQQ